MEKCLFFVCPTDYLESTISKSFHFENYFYSTLGNSIRFTDIELLEIKKLIDRAQIDQIYFVLSLDNKIVQDALGGKNFSKIKGMRDYYRLIQV